MQKKEFDNNKNFLSWIEGRRRIRFSVSIFIIFCAALFLSDFFYERHPYFSADRVFGFYAIYGFAMFTIIIFASKILRLIVMRSEKFYGSKAVDSEEYPKEKLGMEDKDVS